MGPSTNNKKRAETRQDGQSDKRHKVTRKSSALGGNTGVVQQCEATGVFGDQERPSKTNKRVSVEADNDCVPRNKKRVDSGRIENKTNWEPYSDDDDNDDARYEDTPSDNGTAVNPTADMLQGQKDRYVLQMKSNGHLQGELSQRLALKNHINKNLFTMVKFITHGHQMNFGNIIAKKVMKDLDVPEDYRFQYWVTHQSFITKTLRTKRNNICMTLKNEYLSTYYTEYASLVFYGI